MVGLRLGRRLDSKSGKGECSGEEGVDRASVLVGDGVEGGELGGREKTVDEAGGGWLREWTGKGKFVSIGGLHNEEQEIQTQRIRHATKA